MGVYNPEKPKDNLKILGENVYPGRLLVIGLFGNVAVQAYAIEGRSEDSQNRILVKEDKIVSTETWDKSKPPKHPELTIYDAMRRVGTRHIVSNGDQTSTAIQHLRSGLTFADAMETREYEPDGPTFTPRISAYTDTALDGGEQFAISVIRKSGRSERAIRTIWTDEDLEPIDRLGYCIHTYKRDAPQGEPIPSFTEVPFQIPVLGNAEEMADMLWDSLDHTNLVAVAAKAIHQFKDKVKHSVINLHAGPPPEAV